jgi:choline dehydrogenase
MPFLGINGGPIHYDSRGEGETLLLIAGTGFSGKTWWPGSIDSEVGHIPAGAPGEIAWEQHEIELAFVPLAETADSIVLTRRTEGLTPDTLGERGGTSRAAPSQSEGGHPMAGQTFDVIIVGGGTAGCVAAMRLSADPNRSVLLLEAGPDPWPLPEIVADAQQQTKLLLESDFLTMIPTKRHEDDSTYWSLAGRIMGGGSSVNVMSVVRPQRADLDGWAALGNPDWTYERCLPFMKMIEADQDFPDSPIHGSDGPLFVKRTFSLDAPMTAPVAAFIEASYAVGLPKCPDLNVPDPLGVCPSPYNIRDGRRQSATVAYLSWARNRPNLTILDRAAVQTLRFAGSRVEGVNYERDGELHVATGSQVLLTSGVYGTPQILMLSGIGPSAELARHGIPVRHELRGVGENYQDHAVVYVTFEGAKDFTEDWTIPRFRLITRANATGDAANFHIMMRPPTAVRGLKRMLPVSAHLLEQRARGRVYLQSADAHDHVAIDSAMLEHPEDVRAMVETMGFLDELVHQPQTREYYGPMIQPEPGEDWGTFARRTYDSYHHGAGTCKMGPASDATAVVNQRLRVHGLDNLWIGDASIMPVVPRAHLNLTALLIGERLSDFVGRTG